MTETPKEVLRRKESLPKVYNRAWYFVAYGAYGMHPKVRNIDA